MNRTVNLVIALLLICQAFPGAAAPREAGKNDAAVVKLQAMVKSLTAERDAAKAESAKLAEELKPYEQLKKDHSAALAAKAQISDELSAQKHANGAVSERLEQTNARLREAIEKHKEVSQAKAELAAQLAAVTGKQQATSQQLDTCDQHNVMLYEAARELLDRYEHKDAWAGLLAREPLLKFNSVEMETIVQEYQDKLAAAKYLKQSAADQPAPAAGQ